MRIYRCVLSLSEQALSNFKARFYYIWKWLPRFALKVVFDMWKTSDVQTFEPKNVVRRQFSSWITCEPPPAFGALDFPLKVIQAAYAVHAYAYLLQPMLTCLCVLHFPPPLKWTPSELPFFLMQLPLFHLFNLNIFPARSEAVQVSSLSLASISSGPPLCHSWSLFSPIQGLLSKQPFSCIDFFSSVSPHAILLLTCFLFFLASSLLLASSTSSLPLAFVHLISFLPYQDFP